MDMDMNDLLRQAQEMQQQLAAAQQNAAAQTVEGVSGGGMVRIEVTGGMEFLAVHVDPKVVDPTEVDMLEDLILAAIRDAAANAHAVTQQAMGGLNLPGLSGLLG